MSEAKSMHVQTVVAQATVQGFDEGIFHGFPGTNTIQLPHPPTIGPVFKRPGLEFRAMIHCDRSWSRSFAKHAIEGAAHGLAGHPNTGL